MVSPELAINYLLPAIAFAMGACIGSFLNVVIYRVPLGISVNEPKRSFCFSCKKQIPIYLNIPLVSWVFLRGKCKFCGSKIAFRYFLVELLTAICFLAIWKKFFPTLGFPGVIAFWIFVAMLISATFIDFDHFIIPDSITIGGTVIGLLASFLIPAMHGQETMLGGLFQGGKGAVIGFGLLYLIVLMGKMMFGKIKHEFEEPQDFKISQPGGDESPIMIELGEHHYEWGEVFYRTWDRMELDITDLALDGEAKDIKDKFQVWGDGVELDGDRISLEKLKEVSGKVTRAVVPREAMGFGDVKFMAMIGAFLGWQGAVFTIFAASVFGAVVGLLQKVIAREGWGRPLPFGPYLALAAFVWLFTGPALWLWYVGVLKGGWKFR